MTCPNCGGPLVDLTADLAQNDASAPFLCAPCARAWWPSELAPAAVALWDPATRSHGTSQEAQVLRIRLAKDRDDQAAKREQARKAKQPKAKG